MVRPDHFEVQYAINPHMLNSAGKPHKVDRALAVAQWTELVKTFERLGANVEVLPGASGFPDMVFCANQSFPFRSAAGRLTVLLSKMRHPERRGEVASFHRYFFDQGYDIVEMPDSVNFFEAMGDALIVPNRRFVIGGCGPRTEEKAYDVLVSDFGFEVLKLKLTRDDFYHLDTCLVVLDENTVAYVPSAIENPDALKKYFSRTIEIGEDEALKYFAANAFCFDGHNVVLQTGAKKFCNDLTSFDFTPVEVNTSEFIKAGGSVFCMKMLLPK
jgi:arginine dihydrolase